MIVAYTIGHTESYNKALAEHPDECFKLGETKDYQGGWIWKTAKEAAAFIYSNLFLDINWGDGIRRNPDNFSVYKVLINDWNDVSAVSGINGVFQLKSDSKFTK